MTLNVTFARGGATYLIKADNAQILYERSPLLIPLPSTTTANDPIQIDLGYAKPYLTLTAIVDDVQTVDGGTIPSKRNLEDFLLNNSSSVIVVNLDGELYDSHVVSFSFERRGGENNRWYFNIRLNASLRN